jgi:hypothetical protein
VLHKVHCAERIYSCRSHHAIGWFLSLLIWNKLPIRIYKLARENIPCSQTPDHILFHSAVSWKGAWLHQERIWRENTDITTVSNSQPDIITIRWKVWRCQKDDTESQYPTENTNRKLLYEEIPSKGKLSYIWKTITSLTSELPTSAAHYVGPTPLPHFNCFWPYRSSLDSYIL